MMLARTLALAAAVVLPVQAHAALALVTQQTNDAAFELAGGFLQSYYGLPLVGAAQTALPPLERAVAQISGSRTSNNTGLYVPNASTGIPFQGAGVTQALTNTPPGGGGGNTAWVSNTPVTFTFSRTGNTVTFIQGSQSWSDTQAFYASIDGLELRTRSQAPNANYTSTSITYSNLVYNDAITSNQSLASVGASNGNVLLRVFSGVTGNFSLTGSATLAWAGTALSPGNQQLNAQVKLLDLPAPVPEPASIALLGFGVLGLAALRRRG